MYNQLFKLWHKFAGSRDPQIRLTTNIQIYQCLVLHCSFSFYSTHNFEKKVVQFRPTFVDEGKDKTDGLAIFYPA